MDTEKDCRFIMVASFTDAWIETIIRFNTVDMV